MTWTVDVVDNSDLFILDFGELWSEVASFVVVGLAPLGYLWRVRTFSHGLVCLAAACRLTVVACATSG